MKRVFAIFLGCVIAATAAAAADLVVNRDEALISKAKENPIVKKFVDLSASKIVQVRDIGELYEVVFVLAGSKDKNIFYLTKNGEYALFGMLIDKDGRSVTKERQDELNKVDFSSLPLKDAIVIKKGNGKRKIVMVTDPECPFCKKAFQWIEGKDDFTLYLFLFPLDMHPNSYKKSVEILCSKDEAAALRLTKSDIPIGVDKCERGEKQLKKHILISQVLGVRGTPFFVLESGRKLSGFNPQIFEQIFAK